MDLFRGAGLFYLLIGLVFLSWSALAEEGNVFENEACREIANYTSEKFTAPRCFSHAILNNDYSDIEKYNDLPVSSEFKAIYRLYFDENTILDESKWPLRILDKRLGVRNCPYNEKDQISCGMIQILFDIERAYRRVCSDNQNNTMDYSWVGFGSNPMVDISALYQNLGILRLQIERGNQSQEAERLWTKITYVFSLSYSISDLIWEARSAVVLEGDKRLGADFLDCLILDAHNIKRTLNGPMDATQELLISPYDGYESPAQVAWYMYEVLKKDLEPKSTELADVFRQYISARYGSSNVSELPEGMASQMKNFVCEWKFAKTSLFFTREEITSSAGYKACLSKVRI